MKIAIPTTNGILDPHFGHCTHFSIVETDGTRVTGSSELDPPEHRPGSYPAWLASRGVTDVIAGGIGHKAIAHFQEVGINVFAGAPESGAEELATGLLEGSIAFTENYCDHGGQHHSHAHHGKGSGACRGHHH